MGWLLVRAGMSLPVRAIHRSLGLRCRVDVQGETALEMWAELTSVGWLLAELCGGPVSVDWCSVGLYVGATPCDVE